MSDLEFGEITFRSENDAVIVCGEIPPVVAISDDLLRSKNLTHMRVFGDDILLDVKPAALHFRIIGKSVVHPGTWIAERVHD